MDYLKMDPLNFNGTLTFRKRPMMYTLLGAILIMAGTVLQNLSTKFEQDDKINKIGLGLYLFGWFVIAYAISSSRAITPLKTMLTFGTVMGIVFSTLRLKKLKDNKNNLKHTYLAIFVGSWIVLGYTIGMGWGGTNKWWNFHTTLGMIAAIMVLLSKLIVMPWQRMVGLVDGPGIALCVGAWMLIAFGNSLLFGVQ